MELSVAASLLLIFAIGAVAQWLGWRLRIPAILLLLGAGFLAGPVFGFLNPDAIFGDLLFPIVSGAVAIILFEGGLTLRFHELRGAGPVIFRLISAGVLVSWIIISLLAYYLLDFSPLLAALLGALLTVTGPTVIGPMLRTIRPKGKVRSIAKWEGIIIDPIGVLLAVLVYEIIIAGGKEEAPSVLIFGIVETLLVSIGITAICAGLVLFLIKRRQLPDFLQNTLVLALLLVGFGASNYLREESGLLTATLFGIVLANQSIFEVRHITEFKENLQILLISFLFVVLAARVDVEAFRTLGWVSGVFLLGVILLARPLAVLASTVFSTNIKWRDRALLMMLAPRGIVAVALTSVFVIKLDALGVPNAEQFLALTLLVVIGTVLFYGLSAGWVATRLGLSNLDPQGVIMVGAHDWGIRIGSALKEAGVPVLMIDSNRGNIERSRRNGLRGESGNIFSDEFLDDLDLSDMGHSVALTANDEVNAFARNALGHHLERADTYHLVATKEDNPQGGKARRMNPLFAEGANYKFFHDAFLAGAKISLAVITEEFSLEQLRETSKGLAIPMFCIEAGGRVRIFSAKTQIKPEPGTTIIYLEIPPEGPGLPAPKTKADTSKTVEAQGLNRP